MKLNVFLMTKEEINDKKELPKLNEHYEWIIIREKDISNFKELTGLIRKYKPVCFCTTGNLIEWKTMYELPYEYTKKWIHKNNINEFNTEIIEYCYLHAAIINKESKNAPLFSVITTTFNSGEKIFRPYNSLKNQKYRNWEWILWDDSEEENNETWKQLLKFQEEDIRINCYKSTYHSGYIGEMKWKAGSLSKGEWIVEIDHDDIVDENLFEWCHQATIKYPDANFICSSCVELFEDTEESFAYGDFTAFGYCSYQKQWLRNKWHNVYHIPYLNSKTLRHIVGIPNHVRIWRRSFYEKIGRHNKDLPVVDDYELILRSLVEGKWINIEAPTYYQFRNKNGNNFTFLRNSLIQYLTRKCQIIYEPEITKFLEINNTKDLCKYEWPSDIKLWENGNYSSFDKIYKSFIPDINIEDTFSIILIVDNESTNDILDSIKSIFNQKYQNWLLYIIGNKSNILEQVINNLTSFSTEKNIKKIRWWNLNNKTNRQINLNYVHRMLFLTNLITYIEPGNWWDIYYLKEIYETINEKKSNDPNGFEFLILDNDNINLYNCIHSYDFLKKFNEFNDEILKLNIK